LAIPHSESRSFAYTYPAPGSAHPHGPVSIGEFNLTNDTDGNQANTLDTGATRDPAPFSRLIIVMSSRAKSRHERMFFGLPLAT
jgi:hypothetical protein